jgi:7,8-dihydropterin-6-yl-methyl-4-(beta-D-ribofuranosyl)aminobenzene 5'-phosphate synthase
MKLICLVDDAAQPHSDFRDEHGLSFLIEVEDGRVLFDTGASGTVLLHNIEVARIDSESVSALALSHAHVDHTGGLAAFLERGPGLPVYAHSDLLRARFSRKAGRMVERGLPMSLDDLRQRADLRLSDTAQEILPGVWTTGEIVERPELEGRAPHHFVREGDGWAPDPYRDDMSLVLEAQDGLVLVCGCCHAGLLNTLLHVRRVFGKDPTAVAGGTHLASADEAHLRRLVGVLRRLGPPSLYLNHCTGRKAYATLAQAFGDRVSPCPAGTVLRF